MRYLSVIFLPLIFFISAKGQNVYIPDWYFKAELLRDTSININQDGEIQVAEANAVTNLKISGMYLNENYDFFYYPNDLTGLEAFINLQRLNIDCYFTIGGSAGGPWSIGGPRNINLGGLTHLTYLQIADTALRKISMAGCASLDSLSIDQTYEGGTSYTYNLDTIDLSGCLNLKFLFINGSLGVRSLSLQDCVNLKTVYLTYFGQMADFSGLTNLEEINYQFGGRANLNLSGCTKLRKLNLLYVQMINLNLHDCTGLEELVLQESSLPPNVEDLDLTNSPKLKLLNLFSLPSLKSVNIKNGSSLNNYNNSHFLSDSLKNICADDFEVDSLKLISFIPPDININSYCSFFPGGAYNTISGNIKLSELNADCNSASRNLQGVAVKLKDSFSNQLILEYSNVSGNFHTYTNKGVFTVSPYFPYPYYAVSPTSSTVIFDTANSLTSTVDFCIHGNSIHNDLEVTFLPLRGNRPGFDAYYDLVYKNKGTTTLSGVVQLNFDNSKVNFISTTEPATTQSTGQLSWNYNNLQPFETKTIHVTFNVLPPPVNNINDTISYLATITPTANDETAFDNNFILPVKLSGSLDPNEKQCLEGSKIDISKIGDYLHYQIHFQNEGTDTAFNIVVADTLSEKLDWSSFEFISSSHPVDVKLTNNKAGFIFENIRLPYKAINEPASNGYITFKIKPKPAVVVGDSLNNTAAIYFDFNMPVITNKATTIVTNASTPVPVKVEYFSISSRNNINTLNWKAACTNGSAKFNIERSDDGIHFISIGNITATAIRCQLPFNFTDNNPVEGKNYYRLKITEADGISFYSKILVVGNNNAGLEIKAISGNSIYLNSSRQQTLQLKVIAPDGKLVYGGTKMIVAGNSQLNLQMKGIAAGIYTLVVYADDGNVVTKRFVK